MNFPGSSIQFAAFLFLALFNAGAMTTLQIQHYGIYPYVGRDDFKRWLFMTFIEAIGCFLLNLAALISTFTWQRKLQEEMATTGYDDAKIKRLLSTNWIRTGAFLIQAAFVTGLAVYSCGF